MKLVYVIRTLCVVTLGIGQKSSKSGGYVPIVEWNVNTLIMLFLFR